MIAFPVNYYPYYWDRNNQVNFKAAFKRRIFVDNGPGVKDHPEYIPVMRRHAHELSRQLPQLDIDDVLEPEARHRWVDSRPYPGRRKIQLHKAIDTGSFEHHVGCFIKDESYLDGTKPPRMICARDDIGKTIYGPIFQALNDLVFHLPFCTKHIPAKERPHYIDTYLAKEGSYKYIVTDMSAFECAMRPWLQKHAEMVVYKDCLPVKFHKYLDQLVADTTICNKSAGVYARTVALRFSGDMNTSLGNTITNYLSISTAMSFCRCDDWRAVVEGDDALLRVPADFDSSEYIHHMQRMGFNCRIENEGMNPGLMGYCSMYWNSDFELISDPINTLVTFPIVSPHLPVRNALNLKSLSYAVTSPGEPIIWALCAAFTGLGVTNYNAYLYDELIREKCNVVLDGPRMWVEGNTPIVPPSQRQRDLFEQMYGISPQLQLEIENVIRSDPPAGINFALECLENVTEPNLYKLRLHAMGVNADSPLHPENDIAFN